MAKIEKLDDHRKSDRLTAHLALGAAEPPEVAGGCLSADQLADVATGYCSAEERKAALAHFSSCSQCYNAWVAISFSLAAMESGSPRKKKTSGVIRGFAYLGTAFAVAASVVVFLNVRDTLLETGVVPPVEKTTNYLEQMVSEKDKGEVLRKKTVVKETLISPPAPAPAVPRQHSESRSVGSSALMKPDAEEKAMIKTRTPADANEAEMPSSPSVADMETDSAAPQEILSAAEWLSRIETLCRKKGYQQDLQVWNTLQQQGGQVVDTGSDLVLQRKLKAVLGVMKNVDDYGGADEQCSRIVPLLAGDGDTE